MPNIESSKKRVLTSRKSNLRNRHQKSVLKNSIKRFKVAVENDDSDKIAPLYHQSVKLLDKSVTSNIHHKNYANRKKSEISELFNAYQK